MRRLYVNVGIDEPRRHEQTTRVDTLVPFIRSKADHSSRCDGHIRGMDFTGEDVDDLAAFDHKIGRFLAPRNCDAALEAGGFPIDGIWFVQAHPDWVVPPLSNTAMYGRARPSPPRSRP